MKAEAVESSAQAVSSATTGIKIENSLVVRFDAYPTLHAKVREDTQIVWSVRLRLLNEAPAKLAVKLSTELVSGAHPPISHVVAEFDIEAGERQLVAHEVTDLVRYESAGSINEIGSCLIEWRDDAGNIGRIEPPMSDVLHVVVA